MDSRTEASSFQSDDSFMVMSDTVETTTAPRQRHAPGKPPGGFSGIVWMATFSVVLAITVFIGPKIVEEYSFAYNRGKSKAEYDIAKVALNENPLGHISQLYEYVASKVSPSVVHIDTTTSRVEKDDLLFIRDTKGQGSGVVYSRDGYIVTNQHVVAGAKEVRVTLWDRSVYLAEIVGIDEQTDLAVLKINASNLIPGEWANDESIKVGTMSWAVGSPFGLDQSITSGIISGRHRRVSSPHSSSNADYVFKDLIQTDTAINPGNSGGPLVNAQGKIMGINTSIIGGSYQGVCFAVPADVVLNVVEQIIEQGHVERGFLGVQPEMVSFDYAQQIGLSDVRGAFVKSVEHQTPAQSADIRPGDIIRRWDEKTVDSELTLFKLVAKADVDSTVNLVIYRDGKEMTKSVKIGSRSQRFPAPSLRQQRRQTGFFN